MRCVLPRALLTITFFQSSLSILAQKIVSSLMFGIENNKNNYPELGGEIHQDRKRRERNALIIFGIVAIIVLNIVLYYLANP